MTDTPTQDATISGGKIAPLDSDIKTNAPHDSHSSVGDTGVLDKTHIDPLGSTTETEDGTSAVKSTVDSVVAQASEGATKLKDTIVDAAQSAMDATAGKK